MMPTIRDFGFKISKQLRAYGLFNKWLSTTVGKHKVSPKHVQPEFYQFYNGDKQQSVFTMQEFQRRLSKLRNYMSKENISASILTSYQNINYYSGFIYCQFGRRYALIVTHDKSFLIAAAIDGGQPWRRAHADDVVLYTDWKKDNYDLTMQRLLVNSGVSGTIGVEFDHLTLENYQKLAQTTMYTEKVDIGFPCMKLRMLKSPEELDVTRNGAAVSEIGGYAALEAIRENVPEHVVTMHSTQAMVKEIARLYPEADLMDTWTWFQSGVNTDGAHNPVTSRTIQKGDILSINCFPMIQGYYTALERTAFFHSATAEQIRLWEINCEVHRQGCALIKAGAKCCDIANKLNEIYRHYNIIQYRTFGYGHSFGTLCHYYGREAGLELREDVTTILEPGMAVSMEPMISLPEGHPGAGGYREHDILIVHEDYTENITKFPYGPETMIIKAL